MDKFPLFLSAPRPGFSTVVTFSFIDPGLEALTGFLTHLRQYQTLFRELADFRFLYISGTPAHFEKATELFNSQVKVPLESDIAADLIRYFRTRSIWSSSEFKTMNKTELLFLDGAKRRFAGDRFEALLQNLEGRTHCRGRTPGGVSVKGVKPEGVLRNLSGPEARRTFGLKTTNEGEQGAAEPVQQAVLAARRPENRQSRGTTKRCKKSSEEKRRGQKTRSWAGATPLFGPFGEETYREVAPAHLEHRRGKGGNKCQALQNSQSSRNEKSVSNSKPTSCSKTSLGSLEPARKMH